MLIDEVAAAKVRDEACASARKRFEEAIAPARRILDEARVRGENTSLIFAEYNSDPIFLSETKIFIATIEEAVGTYNKSTLPLWKKDAEKVAVPVATCESCQMVKGIGGEMLHQFDCPTEEARRRAIVNPEPGAHDYYLWNIQKLRDENAAGAGARAKAFAAYYLEEVQRAKNNDLQPPPSIVERTIVKTVSKKVVEPVNPLTANSLIPLLTDLSSILTGDSGKYQPRRDLERVYQPLLTWAAGNCWHNYIDWPERRDAVIRELFRLLGKPFPNIRPLDESDPIQDDGSGSGRGGFSGHVILARPTDMGILGKYREGVERADAAYIEKKKKEGSTDLRPPSGVKINDYKLVLQLHLDHQFEIKGPVPKKAA